MTTSDDDYIRIPAPKFELHQFVTLYWNEQEHNTRITERLFNLDDEVWLDQVAGSEKYYSSDVLEAEVDNSDRRRSCPHCHGFGWIVLGGSYDQECGYCEGSGYQKYND